MIAGRSVTDLVDWLDGRRDGPPPRPELHLKQTGAEWIETLTCRLNAGIEGRGTGLARALTQLATLVDTNKAQTPVETIIEQARFWAQAWRTASKSDGRRVLRWSVLTTSWRIDDPPDSNPRAIGYLKDFGELRAIEEAIERAKHELAADADAVKQALASKEFNRRLDELRQGAGRRLILSPLELIAIAASFPALLALRSGDDPAAAAALEESVRAILIASHLYEWIGHQPPKQQKGLVEAAELVAEHSFRFGLHGSDLRTYYDARADNHFLIFLRRYWEWALAPGADQDCTLWRDAVGGALALQVRAKGLSGPIRFLLQTCRQSFDETAGNQTNRTQIECAVDALDAGLGDLLQSSPDPARTAFALLEAFPDLRDLAPDPRSSAVTDRLVKTLYELIKFSLSRAAADPDILIDRFLPRFSEALAPLVADTKNMPTGRLVLRVSALVGELLNRLLDCGPRLPREPVTLLFERLERLVYLFIGSAQPPKELEARMADLASLLARCTLAWAAADPSEPWFNQDWFRTLSPLTEEPIRMRLARQLLFPRCAYFAAVSRCDGRHSPETNHSARRG